MHDRIVACVRIHVVPELQRSTKFVLAVMTYRLDLSSPNRRLLLNRRQQVSEADNIREVAFPADFVRMNKM